MLLCIQQMVLVQLLADAVEVLIGAIYVDKGLEKRKNLLKIIIKPFAQHSRQMEDKNYKSQLLEYAQANKLPNPFYKILKRRAATSKNLL